MALLVDTQIRNNLYATGSIQAGGGFTGSLLGTASFAISASWAPTFGSGLATGSTYPITSSWALNAVSASWAPTNGTGLATGSTYPITASWSNNTISASYAASSSFSNSASISISSSYSVTSSFSITASYWNSSSIATILNNKQNNIATGSTLPITASWAINSISSSYWDSSSIATILNNKQWNIATGSTLPVTSSWATNVVNPNPGSGTNNYLPKWNNNQLTPTSNVFDDGINVGIATATPSALLHVHSTVSTRSIYVDDNGGYIQIGDNTGKGLVLGSKITEAYTGSNNFSAYIAYDAYFEETSSAWRPLNYGLNTKWKQEMSFHSQSMRWSVGTVSQSFSGSNITNSFVNWNDLMTLSSSGQLLISASITASFFFGTSSVSVSSSYWDSSSISNSLNNKQNNLSTGSTYPITASWAVNSVSSSYWNSSSIAIILNNKQWNLNTGSTYPITASWAVNTVSASYWDSSSISNSLNTKQNNLSTGSTYPITASWALNAISSSWALTSSFTSIINIQQLLTTQSLYSTQSLYATQSISASYASTASYWDSSSIITLINTKQNNLVTGSTYPITASWALSASSAVNSITASNVNWPNYTITYVGFEAKLNAITQSNSTMFGYQTFRDSIDISDACAFGEYAASNAKLASNGVFVGSFVGQNVITGSSAVMVGSNAGFNTKDATWGTFIGNSTVAAARDAFGTVAVGSNAFQNAVTVPLAIAIGWFAGQNVGEGSNAIIIGNQAAINAASCSNDIIIGNFAGKNVRTSSYTSLIGYFSDIPSDINIQRSVAIGYRAVVSASDTIVLGGTGADAIKVSIGGTSAVNQLDVVGNISCSVITASLFYGTASWAISASWAPSGTGANLGTGSTYPFTASWAANVISASYANTSSFSNTASYWNSSSVATRIDTLFSNKQNNLATGSTIPITSSWALNAISASWAPTTQFGLETGSTYPITASWANNVVSSSYSITSSFSITTSYWNSSSVATRIDTLFSNKQNNISTGSTLPITASWALNSISSSYWDSSSVATRIDTLFSNKQNNIATGSTLPITASWAVSASWSPFSSSGANPTSQIGLTTVNGTALTFMRSDAAPSLDIGISPFWTGSHTFTRSFDGEIFPTSYTNLSNVAASSLATISHEYTLRTTDGNNISALRMSVQKSNAWASQSNAATSLLFRVSRTATNFTYFNLGGNGASYIQIPTGLGSSNPVQLGYGLYLNTVETATSGSPKNSGYLGWKASGWDGKNSGSGTITFGSYVVPQEISGTVASGSLKIDAIISDKNGVSTIVSAFSLAAFSGYTGNGTQFLSDDGTYKTPVASGLSTGSTYPITTSWAINSISTSYWDSSSIVTILNNKQWNLNTGSTYPITSSWSINAISTSYWDSSSVATRIDTLFSNKQNNLATGSTIPITASYSLNAISASWAPTTQSGLATGSTYPITASWALNAVTTSYWDSSSIAIILNNKQWNLNTGSTYPITASWALNVVNTPFIPGTMGTGSTYPITSSWALNVSNSVWSYDIFGTAIATSSVLSGTTSFVMNTNVLQTSGYLVYVRNSGSNVLSIDYNGQISCSVISASLFGTASQAITASYWNSSSVATRIDTLFTNKQNNLATGSTIPITASWALNDISSSLAQTASYWNSSSVATRIDTLFTNKQNNIATGSTLPVTSSWALNSISSSYWDSSSIATILNNKQWNLATGSTIPITSSWAVSASWAPSSPQFGLETGSTYPFTSSWAINAVSASYWNSSSVATRIDTLFSNKQNNIATGSILPVTSSWALNTSGSVWNYDIFGTAVATSSVLSGTTSFVMNSAVNQTSGYLVTLKNSGSVVLSVDYNGQISCSVVTASLFGTASQAITASYWNSSSVATRIDTLFTNKQNNIATGSLIPVTSSWALNSISSSYWDSSSIATILNNKQWNLSTGSTIPITSSWATNVVNAPFQTGTMNTGSTYPITSSWALNSISTSYWDSSSVAIRIDTLFSNKQNNLATGSTIPITSSWATNVVNLPFVPGTMGTGSTYPITSSWANNVISASYWDSSSIATILNNKQWNLSTGSTIPITASYALNAISASWAPTTQSGLATGSTYPITASWALNVISSSLAQTASYWNSSSVATRIDTLFTNKQNNISTGSTLPVTASWAVTALTSSTSVTASYLNRFNFDSTSSILPTTGTFIVELQDTASYNAAWFDYTALSASSLRSGTVIANWLGNGTFNYTEYSTTDIGNTQTLTMSVNISASIVQLSASVFTNPWTIKVFSRYL